MLNPLIFAFDLTAVAVLTHGIYYRRHGRRDMALAYVGLNVGVMAVTSVLATAIVGAGLGLGLFGILSIIRLRSSEISQEEVAYYFCALTLGLVAGVQHDPAWLSPLVGSMLVAVMFVADHPRLYVRDRHQLVVLGRACTDERDLTEQLEAMLGGTIRRLAVLRVDLVRDLTEVDVRYRLHQSAGAGPAAAAPASATQAPVAGLQLANRR